LQAVSFFEVIFLRLKKDKAEKREKAPEKLQQIDYICISVARPFLISILYL